MHHWQIMEIGRRLKDFIDDINIIHHQTEIEITENLLNRILNHHQWRQIIDGDNYKLNKNDSLHQ